MKMYKPFALVAGAGLGQSILARFQDGGYTAAGLGRTRPDAPVGRFYKLDLSDEAAVPVTLANIIAEFGPPKVVIHNAAELVIAPFIETRLEDYRRTWGSMVQSAILIAQSTMQPMVRSGGGAFIVSGATASLRGSANLRGRMNLICAQPRKGFDG
jgi:NAD(P)-dependent dehydrogenase (short-subunit alcohol dehydrogenase family)